MRDDIAISVKNVSKSFRLPHEQHSGFKQFLINALTKGVKKGYENQHVLSDVYFEIKKGEFFGVVGRNGSGKSTLLKILAGIYNPDRGEVSVNGTLVPFIELGVGFNPELTGRENVFLNGALLGFSRKEIDTMYKEIVDFAELNRFMDQKLKNYSSGMQVRLAFSIAIRAQSDILVLDEVLAVGDEAFQRKCFAYFAELKKQKKTVILVTHSMDSVQQFCTRAMLIDKGEVLQIGKTSRVAEKYTELNNIPRATLTEKIKSKNVATKSQVDVKADCSVGDDFISFSISAGSARLLPDTVVTIVINKSSGEKVFQWSTDHESEEPIIINKSNPVFIRLKIANIFPDGRYDVQIGVKTVDRSTLYGIFNQICTFDIVNPNPKKRDSNWKPAVKAEVIIK